MPSVQIKDVPVDVHRTLRARAAREGKSLQEYLRARLTAEARQPTLEEVLARVEGQSGGRFSFREVVDILRDDREAH